MKKKGKRNEKSKSAPARNAGKKTRSQKRSPGLRTPPRDFTPEELRSFNRDHPRKRSSAQFRFRRKYTRQLTDALAVETVQVRATKGRKPVSNSTSAAAVLARGATSAKKKFSRKRSHDGKGERYTARISLKWKSKSGKWVKKSLSATAENIDDAMKLLLENEQLNSNTYERWDEEEQDLVQEEIASKNKRIVQVSFDKYVSRKAKSGKHGKVSKASKSKTRK